MSSRRETSTTVGPSRHVPFLYYLKEQQHRFTGNNREKCKQLGLEWQDMTDAQRRPYVVAAQAGQQADDDARAIRHACKRLRQSERQSEC
jgi:hypothetical protein